MQKPYTMYVYTKHDVHVLNKAYLKGLMQYLSEDQSQNHTLRLLSILMIYLMKCKLITFMQNKYAISISKAN